MHDPIVCVCGGGGGGGGGGEGMIHCARKKGREKTRPTSAT